MPTIGGMRRRLAVVLAVAAGGFLAGRKRVVKAAQNVSIEVRRGETVGIVRFLMLDSKPSAEVIDAVESAVTWFRANSVKGVRWVRKNGESVAIADKSAPPIWARFYEIDTMRPIFIGRDGVVKYDVRQIDAERRNGYAWYVDSPADLLADYAKWQAKVGSK